VLHSCGLPLGFVVAMGHQSPFGVETTDVHTTRVPLWLEPRVVVVSSLSDGLEGCASQSWSRLVWGVAHLMGFEVERRLEGQKSARLSSRPLVDGWLADLMSSQRVLLCGKADSKRMGMVVAKLIKWSFVHL